jgi:hypothetical protein
MQKCDPNEISVCQDIADALGNVDRIAANIIEFSNAFDLVPHGRLLVNIANLGVMQCRCTDKGILPSRIAEHQGKWGIIRS